MKDLSKANELKRAELITDLQEARKEVRGYQTAVEAAISDLNAAITAYNAVLEQVHSFRSTIAEEIEADWSEEADDWYGSPESEAQEEWKNNWEPGYAEALDEVEDIKVDPMHHAEELADLPSSPE
jgi:hypothetical protein